MDKDKTATMTRSISIAVSVAVAVERDRSSERSSVCSTIGTRKRVFELYSRTSAALGRTVERDRDLLNGLKLQTR